jgi:hypothetical protein
MLVAESLFYAFPVALLGAYFIFGKYWRYSALKRDIDTRIKHFNFIHFAFNDKLFADYQKKAELTPKDFIQIDSNLQFKTEILHKKETAYQDLLRIVNGLADMQACRWGLIVYSALLAWLVLFLITP